MKSKIINFIKTSKISYDLYFYFGSLAIRLLGVFVKQEKNRILFISFGGKKFDDSPKAIYDELIKEENFTKEYDIFWAFAQPEKYEIPVGRKIKVDTFYYFIIALSSSIWVTNVSIERGLKFKKKNTFYINTWHGTPLKKVGVEVNSIKSSGLGRRLLSKENVFLAQSEYDAQISARVFNIEKEYIFKWDLPRNDGLVNYSCEIIDIIKQKLKIEEGKKVILYAPTYRDFDRTDKNECFIKPPIDFDKWEKLLGDDYLVLFRAHHEVAKVLGLKSNDFVKNVSNYPKLNDLIIISDMLISDYSSIFFDYAITEKPMYCFAYDLETYNKKRGLYLDIENEFPCKINRTEDQLLNDILTYDPEKINKVKDFKYKFAPNAGHASEKVVELIKTKIM